MGGGLGGGAERNAGQEVRGAGLPWRVVVARTHHTMHTSARYGGLGSMKVRVCKTSTGLLKAVRSAAPAAEQLVGSKSPTVAQHQTTRI